LTAAEKFEKKTMWVVLLTAVTMVVEITTGLVTHSMALLADGIHMGSHVLAIGLSWLAYVYVRKASENEKYKVSSERILSLSGYTSGMLLLIFAIFIIVQATERFFNPLHIEFRQAIIVAIIGLGVNIGSAFLLHHDEKDSDQNIKAAYLHVIADAVTSVSAILGLTAAMIWNISYVDTIAAVISSFVIIKWAIGLLKDSGRTLISPDNI
jgi:cation diffusion facilitator family transporter